MLFLWHYFLRNFFHTEEVQQIPPATEESLLASNYELQHKQFFITDWLSRFKLKAQIKSKAVTGKFAAFIMCSSASRLQQDFKHIILENTPLLKIPQHDCKNKQILWPTKYIQEFLILLQNWALKQNNAASNAVRKQPRSLFPFNGV